MSMDNTSVILAKFAKLLNLPIKSQVIYDELLIHPDYPSLLAISDVLTHLDIDNLAFRSNDSNFQNIPCPFIAQTHLNNGDFVIVNSIVDETVLISTEKWNKHKLSLTEFKKISTGAVLAVEPAGNTSIITKFQSILGNLKFSLAITGLILAFISLVVFNTEYITNLSWQILLLTILKSTGVLTSVLLLIQSIDNDNPLIQKLCQSGGNKNCSVILSSNAANAFWGLTWSEIGFFYFAGTWLLLIFGGNSLATKQIIAVLNFVSLPYTIYSIYYQARIAKQWCILCCTVQILLWLEFITLISIRHLFFKIDLNIHWSSLFITLILPVILWTLLKPLFLKAQQLYPLKKELQKFKYNAELFNNRLTASPQYPQPNEEWCLVLGDAKANNVITMVTNPYCQPCAKTHKLLDELLKQKDNIQARIVFTANNTEEDIKTPISRHLMALYRLSDKKIVVQGLHDWYKEKNYETWAKTYPVQINQSEYDKIDKQYAWCQMAEITTTPMVLLNGFHLKSYRLSDLKYMLE